MVKKKLKIIYEDKDILVVSKKAGLLTISTDNEKEKTLFHEVFNYIKSKNKNNKIFIVHRLDRDTSGMVVFAKSEAIKKQMQDNWETDVKLRQYVAVVEGKPKKASGRIVNYLAESKNLHVYETNKKEGKLAITRYRTVSSTELYSLVAIELETGRKNQIRVHMSNMNSPIVGDKKYGAKTNPIRRMCLHANKLILIHPRLKKEMTFETAVPKQFVKLLDF